MKIKLNPDEGFVEAMRSALRENDGYCPCAVTKTEDTKCVCKDFREQIAKGVPGQCHCGLYEGVIETEYMTDDELDAFNRLDSMMCDGYIDINQIFDEDEFDLISKALKEYKQNHTKGETR